MTDLCELLRTAYDAYISGISTAGAAVSLETCSLLWEELDRLDAEKSVQHLADAGSGFSSFVLRAWVKERRSFATVSSCDDNAGWLAKTKQFCSEHGLDNGEFLTWDEFIIAHGSKREFDLVFHDLGDRHVRAKTMESMLNTCARVAVLDDMHKGDLSAQAIPVCEKQGFSYQDVSKQTLDSFGRYAGIVRRKITQ